MRYAALRNKLLIARERRQECLATFFSVSGMTLIQLGLNIPGAEKSPPQADDVMRWAESQLQDRFAHLLKKHTETDELGPWSIYITAAPAGTAKRRCCAIEGKTPFARLLDLDVYTSGGSDISRHHLNLKQRKCLVCRHDARECIRRKRHDEQTIISAAWNLLKTVPACSPVPGTAGWFAGRTLPDTEAGTG